MHCTVAGRCRRRRGTVRCIDSPPGAPNSSFLGTPIVLEFAADSPESDVASGGADPPPPPEPGSGSQQLPSASTLGTPEQFQFLLRKVGELENALQKKEEEAKKEKEKTNIFPPEPDEHGFRYYLVKDGASKTGGAKEGAFIGVGVGGATSGLKEGMAFSPSASGDIVGFAQLEESVSGLTDC